MNRWAVFFLVLAALMLVLGFGCAGVSFGDIIKVKTPQGIQESAGLPPTLTYNDSLPAFNKWKAAVLEDGNAWKANIDSSGEWFGFFKSFLDMGVQASSPLLMGLPGGGIVLAGLTGAAGLFMRRPGEKKEMDAAWDDAVRQTLDAVSKGLNAPYRAAQPKGE